MMTQSRFLFVCVVLHLAPVSAQQPDDQQGDLDRIASLLPAAVNREVDFLTEVQPIFRQHCFECHSGNVQEGELNLAVKASAMKGGEHGAVLVPSNSAQSLMVHLISGLDSERIMPPDDKTPLTDDQIGVLRAWIDQGAQWPAGADIDDPIMLRASQHWAFQRLRPVDPPSSRDSTSLTDSTSPTDSTWGRTNIDAFIGEALRANGISPSPPATAQTLVRRIYFDLHGLPPSPEQVERFCAEHEERPEVAVAQLVDQLLDSHHFGERWARHWLDVARYADSDGQESDRDRPHAYHYRDFVIKALNDDMPYDQFVRWQLAGDEYEPDNDMAISATGFLAAGPSMKLEDKFLERERLFNRYNELDDIISTVGTGLLGLTVGCARCHDHKYDAFSAREYYQLMSVFHSGDRINAKLPSGDEGFFFQDFDEEVRTTWLFRRSDFYDREIEVSLGFPAILSTNVDAQHYWDDVRKAVAEPKSTLQRRALADWMTDVDRGGGALLARVIVNRVWQHHFGQGLVRTPSDFGVRGDSPTHPELLEHLTEDFVRNGWKLKPLHRQILTSEVWQQGSEKPSGNEQRTSESHPSEVDPQNRLLWKMVPQRLEAEILRDAMLVVSGTLNTETGGPGFKPYIPPEANLARNIQGGDYPKDAKDDASTRRRSVYMFHKRLVPYPLFQAFDRPDQMVSCAIRQNTQVAPQSLALLNDRFVRSVSTDFAKRLLEMDGDDNVQLVQHAFKLAFGREPNQSETEASTAFIQSQTQSRLAREQDDARLQAVTDYCQSLFSLNEFLYVD